MKVLLFLLCLVVLFANPTNPVVMQGEGSFHSEGPLVEITAADKTIIDWQSFSVAENETTRFIQPNSLASVLNRVTGDLSPSYIHGLLEANGRVILVNPNGVIVSPKGVIQAADFIAATYDLVDKNDWSLHFNQSEIKLSGAINMDGIIRAKSIQKENGSIFLVAETVTVGGHLDAPSGHIEIMGDHLKIEEGSLIDASGVRGGGTILIGTKETSLTETAKDAFIKADCLEEGDGGRVILWADRDIFLGDISVRGGPQKGDGGFAEVSGNELIFDGPVHLNSFHGNPGTLYLDPTDVMIDGSTDVGVAIGNPTTWTGPGCPVNISASIGANNISTSLAGGNVTINTAQPPSLCGLGVITMFQGQTISWNNANTFTLIADNMISIQGMIHCTGTGTINITAPILVFGNAANTMNVLVETNGTLNITASGTMNVIGGAGGGLVTLTTGVNTAPVNINVNGGDLTMTSVTSVDTIIIGQVFCGPVTINVTNGSLIMNQAIANGVTIESNNFLNLNISQNLQATSSSGGGIFIVSSGAAPSTINVGNNFTSNVTGTGNNSFIFSNSNLTVNVGQDALFTQSSASFGGFVPDKNVQFNVGRDFLLSGVGSSFIDGSGSVAINAGRNATIQGAIVAGNQFVNIIAGGSVTLGNGGFVLGGLAPASATPVFILANQNITMGPSSAILNAGAGTLASITLVVDNQDPVPPLIGNGAFLMDPTAALNPRALPVPIQIFTARRAQNSVLGSINGALFVPGISGVNSNEEQWAQYFPQAFVALPFTIFYKETGMPGPPVPVIIAQIISVSTQTIGTVLDLFEEFSWPLPFYDNRFCLTYTGADFSRRLVANPLISKDHSPSYEGTFCPWIEVDNYRKYYPWMLRWGYVSKGSSIH